MADKPKPFDPHFPEQDDGSALLPKPPHHSFDSMMSTNPPTGTKEKIKPPSTPDDTP